MKQYQKKLGDSSNSGLRSQVLHRDISQKIQFEARAYVLRDLKCTSGRTEITRKIRNNFMDFFFF